MVENLGLTLQGAEQRMGRMRKDWGMRVERGERENR
jgi:hypothetical protein